MQVEHHKSLRELNTFGVDVRAKLFAAIASPEEFAELRAAGLGHEPLLVLGGGSNVLFTRDFDGLVIKNSIPGIEVVREDADHVWVRAGAGEVWHGLVLWCIDRGWGGIENLSLIPGQVGAAPIQNIGAYGVELESVCERVEAIEIATGDRASFDRRECEFGYRDSVFKRRHRDRFLVTSVTLRLDKKPRFAVGYGDVRRTLDEMGAGEPTLRAVSDAIVRIRRSKLPDPQVLGNAGSFFQNPVLEREAFERLRAGHPGVPHWVQPGDRVKVPAAWLIERAGWKGRREGRAGVHDAQALVLVNHGGATGGEISALGRRVQQAVQEAFGIELVPEVQIL